MLRKKAVSSENESIARDSLQLISSGATVQLVALLLLIFIGRLYDEEMMGQFGLFLTWGGLIAIAASGRYEQAIMVAASPREAHRLLVLSLKLILLIAIGVLPFAVGMYLLPQYNPFSWMVLLMPLYIVLQASNEAFTLFVLRERRFRRLAWAQAVQGISNNLLKVLLGLCAPHAFYLLLSALLSLFSSLLLLSRNMLFSLWKSVVGGLFGFSRTERFLMRKWRNFPRFGVIQVLTDVLVADIVVLLLPIHFTIAEVGFFTMAVMLCARPLNVLNRAIGNVYFQRMSKAVNEHKPIGGLIRRLQWNVFLIGAPLAVALWFGMDWLVGLVVGPKWLTSAMIIRWMMPAKIPNFVVAIINVLPDIFGKQRANMYAEFVMLALRLVVIYIGFRAASFEAFIAIFFLYQVGEQLIYMLFLKGFARRHDRSLRNA